MTTDAAYMMDGGTAAARMLRRMGRWDEALALLPADAVAERAEILVDRYFWRLDGAAAAEEAVSALQPSAPVLAGYLSAQNRYTRLLFSLNPLPEDVQRAREDFTTATADSRLTGWATFWLGVVADHIDKDPDAANTAYRQALGHAREHGDALLESYAVRHIGAHLLEQDREQGIAQLRRSYHLRASLGARPQTAAAALTLAGELPPGAEADQLRETAGLTARELDLTWLLRAL
ncbi:hypothetical protein A6P39_001935 [Streptomyces sp. FXJ1.172]|uniref:hypothetical protein n=1 Tax=Streptomyces sp. FXJ1.172 TaxID=710705 RepID=UPI00082C7006|nr:hypothetical protein [Streptomyces sp. FXJ1.172]WEO92947.1 hypothetical protein A6P39_001935 [Streptomyces sp. FXJ1.172]